MCSPPHIVIYSSVTSWSRWTWSGRFGCHASACSAERHFKHLCLPREHFLKSLGMNSLTWTLVVPWVAWPHLPLLSSLDLLRANELCLGGNLLHPPSLLLQFKVHLILPVTVPDPPTHFPSVLTMSPTRAQTVLPAEAPRLCPRLCSYLVSHRTLTPSSLPDPSLEISPRVPGPPVSLSCSLIAQKFLLRNKQRLSFSNDTWFPKYSPVLCDFIQLYLSSISNQPVFTNMIIGDDHLMLFCPSKGQIGTQ